MRLRLMIGVCEPRFRLDQEVVDKELSANVDEDGDGWAFEVERNIIGGHQLRQNRRERLWQDDPIVERRLLEVGEAILQRA